LRVDTTKRIYRRTPRRRVYKNKERQDYGMVSVLARRQQKGEGQHRQIYCGQRKKQPLINRTA
jgi:hypothetical protein